MEELVIKSESESKRKRKSRSRSRSNFGKESKSKSTRKCKKSMVGSSVPTNGQARV